MNIGRFFIRGIVAYFLGTLVTLVLFGVVVLLTGGKLQPGSFHSGAAAVLMFAPIAWALAFWWLVRVGFPPSAPLPGAEAKQE